MTAGYGGPFAAQCYANGFKTVIPLIPGSKAPSIRQWEQTPLEGWPVSRLKSFWNPATDAVNNGVGLVMQGQLLAADVDILDAELAFEVAMAIVQTLGDTPITRVGQAPKFIKLYRVVGTIPPTRRFNGFECYTKGGQIVVWGTHPGTKKPYYYPDESPATISYEDLPSVTAADVLRMQEAVAPLLPQLEVTTRDGRAVVGGDVEEIIEQAITASEDPLRAVEELLAQAQQGARHPLMVAAVIRFVASRVCTERLRAAYAVACNNSRERDKDFTRAVAWAKRSLGV